MVDMFPLGFRLEGVGSGGRNCWAPQKTHFCSPGSRFFSARLVAGQNSLVPQRSPGYFLFLSDARLLLSCSAAEMLTCRRALGELGVGLIE